MSGPRTLEPLRRRMGTIVDIGSTEDFPSRAYDIVYTLVIFLNLGVTIAYTFDTAEDRCGVLLLTIEEWTVAYFAVDWALRVWTAKYRYPDLPETRAILKYLLSFGGIVDILSFLPYYLPWFFPAGAVAFRMFRVIRIFRLFRINAYYDSLNVITQVLASKAQQLLSSVFIILVLMTASSLCMYSLEHDAQPQVFSNAFSGIWWAVSTLLTVGYGDIYPITTLGKIFGILITFLGVGMVAIPTGIISAGFVDQYSRIKRISEYGTEADIHFIRIHLTPRDRWANAPLRDLGLPEGVIIAAVQRGRDIIVPRGDVVLLPGDNLVLGAGVYEDDVRIQLKEIVLQTHHPWVDHPLRDLDISRQTVIIMVRRRNRTLIPNGGLKLLAGDKVFLYTQSHLPHAQDIQI